jgi:hypothetical protein
MNLIYASYLGDLFVFIPFFIMVFMAFLAYTVLGFAGILFLTCGFLGLVFVSMSIYFVGAVS